jgi:hypothetical protein
VVASSRRLSRRSAKARRRTSGRRRFAFDEPGAQATARAKAALDALHAASIGRVVVIVSEQVQQPMQSQHLELGGVGVPCFARLPSRSGR